MDRGVMGVQVPHVNTADDARRAVAAVKFGPGAARGLAAGTRPDSWGLGARMPDFATTANAQSLVCVQLEQRGGLAQPRRDPGRGRHRRVLHRPVGPVAVDGLSGRSQGAAGRRGDRDGVGKIGAAGRTPGMPATADTLAEVQAKGCRYIYTHLPRLLGIGASAFLNR